MDDENNNVINLVSKASKPKGKSKSATGKNSSQDSQKPLEFTKKFASYGKQRVLFTSFTPFLMAIRRKLSFVILCAK
ncbi:MAG: hypothetical protein ABL903_20325 [Methylococcales bacterium]